MFKQHIEVLSKSILCSLVMQWGFWNKSDWKQPRTEMIQNHSDEPRPSKPTVQKKEQLEDHRQD